MQREDNTFMKIQKIEFDWTGLENWGFCTTYEVGVNGITKVESHAAQGKWYWTVYFEDGHQEMIFNVNRVFLFPEESDIKF